ncbi:hypothetical protein SAMN05192534_10696 [Alteribacillus persepolensis]|uniref:Uncharacterized protein n=1 Tax=Alteribacillus persepolensis TaxID=568899 RepID=A0A1G8CV28_9BACI|nr:helix-turn-helix domain-containing protein [Alteribacillus persepolensis]SDH49407.1 hypothetical protein SAMN05192534_10696 [Alteribacillus persepolensis]
MEWLLITLFGVSLFLFGISFLLKTPATKEDIEEVSLHTMGEMYQLKQRINRLEEELLTSAQVPVSFHSHESLKKEASQYYQQNMSIQDIAEIMHITEDEARHLLKPYLKGGGANE